MKKLISKISFVGIMLSLVPMVAGAVDTGFNSDFECYIDADGKNWIWYCGPQSNTCKGASAAPNRDFWQKHGDMLDYRNSGKWWCCQEDINKAGRYVRSDEWSKTEFVTETITDADGNAIGKCTWKRETNICGFVDNPQDKCTEATSECEQGYVSHNKKCVKACQTGYAFASETDNNCVKINKNDPTQGTNGGSIVQCKENEFFDKKDLKCIPQTERIQVSTMAFTQCWKCGTPYLLKQCLLDYSKNGTISSDIKNQCGITQKTSGQKTFVDNGSATTSGTKPSPSKGTTKEKIILVLGEIYQNQRIYN